jgi:hypothetical protein
MKHIFIITTVLLIIILLQRECGRRNDWRTWKVINSELTKELDRNGLETAKMSVVSDTRKGAIKKLLISNDSLNIELAKAIKKAGRKVQAVTNVKSTTQTDGTTTTTIYQSDTIIIKGDSLSPDTVFLLPIYESEYKDKWLEYKLKASHDSTSMSLKVFNEYQITHKKIKGGMNVFVKNINPNTKTTDVRAFFIKSKPKRLGIGLSAGATFNQSGQIRPYVGIGLNYNIINL